MALIVIFYPCAKPRRRIPRSDRDISRGAEIRISHEISIACTALPRSPSPVHLTRLLLLLSDIPREVLTLPNICATCATC